MQDLSFHELKGGVTELGDLLQKDKLNILMFYNTQCLGCTGRALPFAYELKNKFNFVNMLIFHISPGTKKESVEEIRSIFTDQKPPFDIYIDEENKLYHHFAGSGTPYWVILDKNYTTRLSIFGSQEGSKLSLELAIEEMSSEFS